jgi:hypothetical protein
VAPFDPTAALANIYQMQRGGQQARLGELGIQMEAIKAQRAQEAYKLQQEMLKSMTPEQRLAFSYAPEQAGQQLAKKLWPERKWTAIAKDGSAVDENGNVIGGQPPIEWGNEGPVQPGPGATLQSANPNAATAPAPAAPQSSQTFPPGAGGAPADLTGRAIRRRETGGHPNPNTARNPNSSASGADQFIASTWLDQLTRNAPEIVQQTVGPNANLKDPAVRQKLLDLREDEKLNTRLSTTLARENAAVLKQQGVEASPSNLVTAHFLGASGAARMLKAPKSDLAVKHASTEAVASNLNVFFEQSTGQPRTVAEVLGMADQMVEQAQAEAGGQGGGGQPPQPPQQAQQAPGGQDGWVTATRNGLPITSGNKPGEYWQRRQIGTTPNGQPKYEYRTAPPGGAGGPFEGTGDGQYWNVLMTGDPSTPVYAAAYHHLTKPQYIQVSDPNNPEILVTKEIRPQLPPNIRVPTYTPPGASGAPPADPNAPPADPNAPQPPPVPPPAPAPAPAVAGAPAATEIPETARGPGQTAQDKQRLQAAEVNYAKITEAVRQYRDVIKRTGASTYSAVTPFPTEAATEMNTAYNNVALLAKGEELYNLGVLNGPDLEIIRRTLADPSTIKGTLMSQKELTGQIDKVMGILDKAMESARKQYGPKPLPGAGGGGAPTVLRFDAEGNPI